MNLARKHRNRLNQRALRRSVVLEGLESRQLMAAAIDHAPVPLMAEGEQVLSGEMFADVSARIVNGQQTDEYESVGIVNNGCSGTLISPVHVLTAAHCTVGVNPQQMSFEVGGRVYEVESVDNHPNYNDNDFGAGYDIAIMTLKEAVVGVEPSAINRQTPEVGQVLTLVGFGEGGTSTGGSTNDFGTKRVGETEIDDVTQTHIEWNFDQHSESNTAPGDSGGPAFLNQGGQLVIAGITSGGSGDAHTLGDNSFDTRVDTLAQWIDGIVGAGQPGDPPTDDSPGDDAPGDDLPDQDPPANSDDDHADELGDDATEILMDSWGGLADGTLEVSGDQDVFSFQVASGGEYEISVLSPESDIDTQLIISDADGNTVAMTSEVGSLADSLLVTQLDAGNYYLTVASDGSRDTGSYYVDIYANGALGSGEDGGFGDFDSPGEDWNDDFTDDDWFAGDDEDGAWDSFLPNGRAHNCDVNQDDAVTALDALLVVNALNSPVSRSVAGIDLDVNSDGALTPLDALLVMNNLNSAEAVSRSIVSQSQQISARSRIGEQVPAIQSRASSESENSRDRRDQLFAEQVDWLYEDSLT